jgi:hypothetical protein
MSSAGGGESPLPPPPSADEEAFRILVNAQGKKKVGGAMPKFIRKLEDVPVIDLPPDQPMSVVIPLEDRALVRQFTGLWPSPRTVDNWIQKKLETVDLKQCHLLCNQKRLLLV